MAGHRVHGTSGAGRHRLRRRQSRRLDVSLPHPRTPGGRHDGCDPSSLTHNREDDEETDYESSIRSRSEEHTSELQSLMRISYAVFCLKKKKNQKQKVQYNKDKNISNIQVT